MPEGDRKLAAVMFTDMVGFTALTQSDEAQAMEVLERHNRLLRPFFPKFHGREVKTIGDSFLVEFDSALDAVRCAQEIQSYLHDYNISTRDEWKITLRIGIHIGDVIHQGGDVFGDAVNIASRLQPLAFPEGICVSDQVFGEVSNKIPQALVRLPAKGLKGVASHVDVYRLVMPWEGGGDGEVLLDTRRVAVLPFSNLSPDPEDEFFADGLTEELIDRLCQVKGLEVIARTSVMSYKKKETKAGTIGKELRAGALVEGSVRKAGSRIRVTAQLIDTNKEAHLWSSRYDRDLQDVFAVQTDIAEQVAGALKVQLVQSARKAVEQAPTQNMEAYTLYLRGRFLWNKRASPSVREALGLFQMAVEKDPNYGRAFAGIADCYSILIDRDEMAWSEGGPKAMEACSRALQLDPSLPEAHASMGLVLHLELKTEEASREFEKAIELNPGYASAYQWYSIELTVQGKLDEADRAISMAAKADPLSAVIMYNSGYLAWVHGRDAEALEKWNRGLELNPDFGLLHGSLAAFYVKKGQKEDALRELRLFESSPVTGPGDARQRSANIAALYGFLGERGQAERHLKRLISENEKTPVPASDFAYAYGGLGDADKFFEYLMKAIEDRTSFPAVVRSHPLYAGFRSDPKFKEYLAARGLPGGS